MKNQNLLPGLLGLALLASTCSALADVSSDAALKALKAGNARYIVGKSDHPRIDAERRRATALEGQTPIAAILGCADSRVPPEIVFDQGFADLFVVRVAGNVCAMPELASIEYSVAALKVPLIVVFGHTKCGAVDAAIKNKPLPGSLPDLVKMIRPAVEEAEKEKGAGDDLLTRATERHVARCIEELKKSPVIKAAIDAKQLKIVGAMRHIKDGHVSWLK
ncbi:MAG: carbonic anhydrase [Candidatus Obscuribacter sp.]|jgi:carbonic anhydrase|nr:carbonic anhydrase [Candidatus Obscuribacter sp.]MBP6594412.1 carbonic anhydrase [Candidatus Obscuribacter sp.]MBP7576340.1 carbonic anhydrase [Candidatus Obscuribacter sp.]